mgnify:CR=1 FL=1
MKTYKRIVICITMMMASMNLMAQRETLTFTGTLSNFPHGGSAEVALTIKPDGKFTMQVRESQTVSAFTISGQVPAPMLDMPGSDGQRGPKAEGFNWAFPIAEYTAFSHQGSNFTPVDNTPKGMMMGRTENGCAKLKLSLQAMLNGQRITVPLECTLKK